MAENIFEPANLGYSYAARGRDSVAHNFSDIVVDHNDDGIVDSQRPQIVTSGCGAPFGHDPIEVSHIPNPDIAESFHTIEENVAAYLFDDSDPYSTAPQFSSFSKEAFVAPPTFVPNLHKINGGRAAEFQIVRRFQPDKLSTKTVLVIADLIGDVSEYITSLDQSKNKIELLCRKDDFDAISKMVSFLSLDIAVFTYTSRFPPVGKFLKGKSFDFLYLPNIFSMVPPDVIDGVRRQDKCLETLSQAVAKGGTVILTHFSALRISCTPDQGYHHYLGLDQNGAVTFMDYETGAQRMAFPVEFELYQEFHTPISHFLKGFVDIHATANQQLTLKDICILQGVRHTPILPFCNPIKGKYTPLKQKINLELDLFPKEKDCFFHNPSPLFFSHYNGTLVLGKHDAEHKMVEMHVGTEIRLYGDRTKMPSCISIFDHLVDGTFVHIAVIQHEENGCVSLRNFHDLQPNKHKIFPIKDFPQGGEKTVFFSSTLNNLRANSMFVIDPEKDPEKGCLTSGDLQILKDSVGVVRPHPSQIRRFTEEEAVMSQQILNRGIETTFKYKDSTRPVVNLLVNRDLVEGVSYMLQ